MKGIQKKLYSATLFVALFVMGLFSFSLTVLAADDTVATLNFASSDWGVQYWYGSVDNDPLVVSTEATVNGFEQYTVSLDFSGLAAPANGIAFVDVEIMDGEALYPNSYMTIDEIKINDEVVVFGPTYTSSDNAIVTRTNLYNAWVSSITEGRTPNGKLINGDGDQVTPVPLAEYSSLAITSIEVTFTLGEGQSVEPVAYINFADSAWGVQYWYGSADNDALIVSTETVVDEEDGQYTVSLDFTGTTNGFANGIAFLDVEIQNGEYFYEYSFMQIDSILINGVEAVLSSDTYTSSDNANDTRTNLFNAWVSKIGLGRTADGNAETISAIPLSDYATTQIETISVTFTLMEGVGLGAQALPEEGVQAYIQFAESSWTHQYWFDGANYAPVVANNTTVTGYGQYTVSIDFTGTPEGFVNNVAFFDVEVEDGEIYFPWNYMRIDEILVNGDPVTLTADTYTTSDDGIATRTNLYNDWVSELPALARFSDDASADTISAKPLDVSQLVDIATISVTFTLIEGEPISEEPYVQPDEFKAFMMFSSEFGGWQRYNPSLELTGDTMITGDGTWTVFITAAEGGANDGTAVTGQAETAQVFLVDIVGLGEAMVHLGTLAEDPDNDDALTITDLVVTVRVWVDNVEVPANNARVYVGDLEGNGRLRLEFYNIYGTGTIDTPVVDPLLLTPTSEIKVEFTLLGTGIEGVTPTDPVDPTDPVVATHNVTFNADNNTTPAVVQVNDGEVVAKPADPTKEGYTFVEWQANGQTYVFTTPVTGNLTLTAVYEEEESGLSGGQIALIVSGSIALVGGAAGVWFFLLKKKPI